MADKTGYIGRNPSDSSVVIARQTFEPSTSTSDFTFTAGYTPGYLDLYINGARQIEGRDYNANDGSTVSLVSAANSGDVLEIIAYKAFNVGDAASSSTGNFAVGNDLSVNNDAAVSQNLNVTGVTTTGLGLNVSAGGANISGVVTATSYQGDGSALTGIAATDTIAAASLTVSGITTLSNELKVTAGGIEVDGGGLDIAGVSTFASDVRIAGNINAGISTFGVVTVTSITGDGSGLTGVANTDFVVSTATTTSRLVVGGGVTVAGIATASSFDGAISEWTLGADGSSNYTFTGPGFTGAENDPKVYLKRGQRYNFKNATGAHPFKIQSTPNGSSPASSGTAYNDGVTNNSAASGTTLIFDVQHDAPNRLYYQCTSHTAMGGEIIIDNGFATQEANGFEVTHAGTASTSRFLAGGSVGVGIGVTTTTGRDAVGAAGTVKGQLVFNETTGFAQVYNGNSWDNMSNKFSASGGTESEAGGYTYHLFESPGTFTVDSGTRTCEAFVVGGGGAGGTTEDGLGNARSGAGGGGGAAVGPVGALSSGDYTVTVGSGGAVNYPAWPAGGTGGSGGTSSFAPGQPFAISATGGGGGTKNRTGGAGGSGSGGTTNGTGGAGNPNDNDPQDSGNTSGVTGGAGTNAAGGGGGGGDGSAPQGNDGGTGGAGTQNMFGSFGCGGGGGGAIDHGGTTVPAPFQGPGGTGYFSGGNGGGAGLTQTDGGGPVGGQSGTIGPTHTRNNAGGGGGTYGGGGGANMDNENAGGPATGGQGAGGVVIVRYLTP